ncbi:MAG: hypothetical protein JNK64_29270 [Myxococcales bacterium]|nr:hypothetical protein [Myxococcales bacterium]
MRVALLAVALAAAACNPVFGLDPVSRGDGGAPADAATTDGADDGAAPPDAPPAPDARASDAAVDARAPVCGDGLMEGAEVCDDGNTATEFDCAYGVPTCRACNFNCTAEQVLTGPFCGDGTVQTPPEECDELTIPSCCLQCMIIPC